MDLAISVALKKTETSTIKNGTVEVTGYDPTVKPDGKLERNVIWTGTVIPETLNVRTWAGTNNSLLKSVPKLKSGETVGVCDVINASDGSLWYYVKLQDKYYGFVLSTQIKK